MGGSKGYSVPSVERALAVLEFLAQSKRGFSISEISRRLALPKSSIHLILGTLERKGYLLKNLHTGRYCFGLKLVGLSRSALENLDLREEARPFLQALMEKNGLTVHLAVLERGEAVIIERAEPPGPIRMADWVGRRLDVNCTGVGKALIAFLSEVEFDRQVPTKGMPKHNSNTIVSVKELKRELVRVRELGYALDDEEDEIGVRCVGAPIFDHSGRVVAALSVAGTTAQVPLERVQAIGRAVRQAAAGISSCLGYAKV